MDCAYKRVETRQVASDRGLRRSPASCRSANTSLSGGMYGNQGGIPRRDSIDDQPGRVQGTPLDREFWRLPRSRHRHAGYRADRAPAHLRHDPLPRDREDHDREEVGNEVQLLLRSAGRRPRRDFRVGDDAVAVRGLLQGGGLRIRRREARAAAARSGRFEQVDNRALAQARPGALLPPARRGALCVQLEGRGGRQPGADARPDARRTVAPAAPRRTKRTRTRPS